MAREFDLLVERLIQKTLAEGELEELVGGGKPLPNRRQSEADADMATAVAVRIMAEAGVLPNEFKLKKLLQAAKRN